MEFKQILSKVGFRNCDGMYSILLINNSWLVRDYKNIDFIRLYSIYICHTFFSFVDYIKILDKPVTSKYSEGLFKKVGHTDGKIFNVSQNFFPYKNEL